MAQSQASRPLILVLEPESLSSRCVMQALQTQDWGADVLDASAQDFLQPCGDVELVVLGFGQDLADNQMRLQHTRQQCPQAVILGICPRVTYAERCALFDAGVDFLLEKPFFVDECVSVIRAVLRRRALGPVPAAWPAHSEQPTVS